MSKPMKEKLVAPLGSRQIELAFRTALRDGDLFQLLVGLIRIDHFSADEIHLAICWRAALDAHSRMEKLPTPTSISAAVNDKVAANPQQIQPVHRKRLSDFLLRLKKTPQAELDVREARITLRRWVEEREFDSLRLKLQDPNNPRSISAFLEEFKSQIDAVAHIESGVSKPLFDDDDVFVPDESLATFSTGYRFIDQLMEGGQARREVNMIMAPYSGGKTALTTSMWYEAGRLFRAMRHKDPGGKRQVAVLAVYEPNTTEIKSRLLVYGAKIPFDRVKQIKDKSHYSTMENLQPYERLMFSRPEARPKPEIVRVREMQSLVREHLLLLDMTESTSTVRAGQGDVAEIVARMRDYQRQHSDVEFSWLGIDYAGVMCNNHVAMNRSLSETSAYRRWLSNTPMRCKNQLAIPFDLPVWLVHQLSADANEAPPWRIPRHTDGAESRTMAENTSFCFCIGTPTPQGVRIFNRSKGRRLSADSDETVLVRLDKNRGKYSTVNDFVLHEGRIVTKESVRSVRDAGQIRSMTTKIDANTRRVDRGSSIAFEDESHQLTNLE